MSNSPDHYHQHTSLYRRTARITIRPSSYDHSSTRRPHTSLDQPFVLGLQATITPRNYQPVAHNLSITITNVSSRDLVERLLRQQDVEEDNLNVPSSPDDLSLFGDEDDYSLFGDEDAYTEEKQDDAISLDYFKTRTHHVAASKDGVKNPTETEEICAICQAEFENEESIGTLGCGHEYHTACIKQWLLRKKDCPMCRASVLPLNT